MKKKLNLKSNFDYENAYMLSAPVERIGKLFSRFELFNKIKDIPGRILSEDMNFTYSTNKEISFQPFEFTQMISSGTWDPQPYYECIVQQCFSIVILEFELGTDLRKSRSRFHFDSKSLELLHKNYVLDENIYKYWIYKPRGYDR